MQIRGQCSCGAVTWEIDGEPVAQFYCNCHSCQIAHSSPLVAIALFPAANVSMQGETRVMSVTGAPYAAQRMSCVQCGTRVMNVPAGKDYAGLRAIFPASCETKGWFNPAMHLYCEDRSIDTADELPKFADLPSQFGGTGRLV